MAYDKDLPDELQRAGGSELVPVDREEGLSAFAQTIAKYRSEAVNARKDSGIEDVWMACEEAYLCIDDLNRGEFAKAKWAKPTVKEGPLTNSSAQPSDGRSTVFVRLTARYVDMGAAKICEIVLPIDDKAFSLKASPVPELIDAEQDKAALAAPDGTPLTVADLAKALSERAQASAEKAEKRIYDWMVEAKYPKQMRKVIQDAARIGVGILKAPFPETRTKRAVVTGPDGKKQLKTSKKVKPSLKWIDAWNFFPQGTCGEDIRNGGYTFERDFISEHTLKKLRDERTVDNQPVYMADQIDAVLHEGPGKCYSEGSRNPSEKANKDKFEIWYFSGTVRRQDMLMMNPGALEGLPDELGDIYAIVTMVNDRVIRVTRNPRASGKCSYHALPWSRRAGHWAGVGVAEQLQMPQKSVNAATRAVFNNAGISAGVQLVIDPVAIVPANGSHVITPNKIWWITPDAPDRDVNKAFKSIDIQNVTQQLMPIIEYGFRLAEEASNIPLISQGQTGPTDPQTFGQAELQNSNANTLLRALGNSVDDHITEPVVDGMYEWLLLDEEVPDNEKGDFEINAQGSSAMVEKAIQEKTLFMMGGLVINPAFGADPEKWFEQMLKTKRMDPRNIMMDEKKKAELASRPPPKAPQVEAAEIREAGALERTKITAGASVEKVKADTDRDRAYVQAENERTTNEHSARMAELQLRRELAMLEYANTQKESLANIKAQLAQTFAKLNTQKELAGLDGSGPQVLTPPTEPPQHAEDGHAYQQ